MDSSILKEVAMVIVGFFLGILSNSIAKDSEAKQKCLQTTSQLKAMLEELYRHMFSDRSIASDLPMLMGLKPFLEKIEVEKTGLSFKCHSLDRSIDNSLRLFENLDPVHENIAYHPTQIANQLISEWHCKDGYLPKFDRIIEIQKNLSRSLPHRFAEWALSFLSYCPF